MATAVCKISNKKLKIEDVLCPICREIYIEPICLPCKHIVCLQCLEKTVENNSLVCPICRTRIGTFIRLAKSLKKIVDQSFWDNLKNQFPSEIKRKLNGEEDGISNKVMGRSHKPVLAERGSIKEEFDEMFHKLRIEEERSRRAEQIASEELAKKIMEEELEQEKMRKRKTEEIAKSDFLYIKSLMMSENGQRDSFPHGSSDLPCRSSSSVSNDHDSISDELRHFTPICIAPKTPPKRLPNGKVPDTTIIKPINLASRNFTARASRLCSVKNKKSLKVVSNNFLRTKPPAVEDIEMDEEVSVINSKTSKSSSDLNSNLTDDIPLEIIEEQELIQKRIKQEQEDMAIAMKLHNKWNKEKSQDKKRHGYQLRSSKRSKRKN